MIHRDTWMWFLLGFSSFFLLMLMVLILYHFFGIRVPVPAAITGIPVRKLVIALPFLAGICFILFGKRKHWKMVGVFYLCVWLLALLSLLRFLVKAYV